MTLPSDSRLDFLVQRSSALALSDPAPDGDALLRIFEAACGVPDHKTLRPYRFVVVERDARARFGDALALAARDAVADLSDAKAQKIRDKAFFAPMLIALIASPRMEASVPRWEQDATAACTGFALVLAAEALGFGAVWKSAPVHEGRAIDDLLALAPHERFLGWVNLGARAGDKKPRARPDLAALVTRL